MYKTYVGPLIDSTKCATKGSVLCRNRTKMISPRDVFARGSVMGETAESIWRRVNIAIVESSLRFTCFTTIVHGSFMFSFKKALLPWNFKCRGDKMLVAYWRPVLKFWSPTLNLWSHWRPVSRNFGPWLKVPTSTKHHLKTHKNDLMTQKSDIDNINSEK